MNTFLRQETNLYTLKEFARTRGLVLTRQDQDQSESVTSILLSSLDTDVIAHQSGNTIRYSFNGTPDLSGVVIGDSLISESNGNASNDGVFEITAVSDGSDYIEVTNPNRSDNTDDEATDAPGTCDVLSV